MILGNQSSNIIGPHTAIRFFSLTINAFAHGKLEMFSWLGGVPNEVG
jgi:hypothetical protein